MTDLVSVGQTSDTQCNDGKLRSMSISIQSRTKFTSGLVVAALAVALTITAQARPAAAATIPETDRASTSAQTQTAEQCEVSADSSSDTAAAEMTQLDQTASVEVATRVAVLAADAGITSHTAAEFVQRDEVKAYAIHIDGVTATSVTFPITGDRFVQPSNFSFILDDTGAINQYSESTVVELDSGIFDLTTYVDGVHVHSTQVDPSTLVGVASASSFSTAAASPNQCIMVVLGVGAITAGIILVMCGGSCSFPYTTPTAIVCAACVAGIATVGGGSVAAVMGCF